MAQPIIDPYERIQQLEEENKRIAELEEEVTRAKEVIKRVTDPNVEGECAICLQSLMCYTGKRISVTSCGHTFHKACITKWWDAWIGRRLCPICRQRIPPCYIVPRYYHVKKTVKLFLFGVR